MIETGSKKGFSLVVPFFNEAQVLEDTLNQLWTFLKEQKKPFELLLGDDGSFDRSATIALEFVQKHAKECRLIKNQENQGRGSILTKAFFQASMPVVIYVDADLEIGLSFVREMVQAFNDENLMVCTGSKLSTSQRRLRARHRKVASIVYNFLVHWLLRSKVSDHQCGLKGFRKSVLNQILPLAKEKGWAWDTEMLLLAQKGGIRIDEFPVQLESKRQSTVPLLPTIFMFLQKIFEFRSRKLTL